MITPADLTNALFLTVRQICDLLNISRCTFYRMMERGEIRTVKVGGSRRVPLWELERLLDSYEEETGD